MAESGIRKRKNAKSSQPPKRNNKKQATSRGDGGDGAMLMTVFLVLVVSGGIFLYNNYDYAKAFIQSRMRTDTPGWDFDAAGKHAVDLSADIPKRDAVVKAFKHAWLAYERDAMGDDEYHPLGKSGSNLTDAGGIGYTVVDSIDTILLMGLDEEYQRARDWVAEKMSFERDGNFNTFEVRA